VARLTAELARQQELLALLVDRVAPSRGPAPGWPSPRPQTPLPGPGEATGQDAINKAILEQFRLLGAAQTGLPTPPAKEEEAVEAGGSGTAQLPLARPAPPLSEFDPEGDVTPTGADSFWTWLDAAARTPWVVKGPYARWADKVQYKCSTAELSAFVARAAPQHLEAAEGRRSKRALVDALARACADQARMRASSGPSGAGAARGRSVLDSLLDGSPRSADAGLPSI